MEEGEVAFQQPQDMQAVVGQLREWKIVDNKLP